MKSNIIATGDFHLKIIEKATGQVLQTFEEKNLVVDLGKANVAKLLGGDVTGKAITQIGCGTGVNAPDSADLLLTNSFIKNISSVSYPDALSTTFHWTIEDTEANGKDLTEFGLFNSSGFLFARKVRSAITKTNAIRLQGSWTIHIN